MIRVPPGIRSIESYMRRSTAAEQLAPRINSKTQELESTLPCKQPNVDSGATAIGSTARPPDERQNSDAKTATTTEAHQLEHIDSVSSIRVHQLALMPVSPSIA